MAGVKETGLFYFADVGEMRTRETVRRADASGLVSLQRINRKSIQCRASLTAKADPMTNHDIGVQALPYIHHAGS